MTDGDDNGDVSDDDDADDDLCSFLEPMGRSCFDSLCRIAELSLISQLLQMKLPNRCELSSTPPLPNP